MQSLSNPKSKLKTFGVTSLVALKMVGTRQKVPEKVLINGLNRLLTLYMMSIITSSKTG